jgi:hypothetical protein
MLHPRQAFSDAEHYMALGRALREPPAAIVHPNVIRFPVERLKPRTR